MEMDQKRCMLQGSNQRLFPEMQDMISITYKDLQEIITWSVTGTPALANSCRNCSVNSPMGGKRELHSLGQCFIIRSGLD